MCYTDFWSCDVNTKLFDQIKTTSSAFSLSLCGIPCISRQHLLQYCSKLFTLASVSALCFCTEATVCFKIAFHVPNFY